MHNGSAALLLLLHCLGCLAAVGLEDGQGRALTLLLPRERGGGGLDDEEEEDEEGEGSDMEGGPPGLGGLDGPISIPTRRLSAHKWANAALSRCLRQAERLPGWGQRQRHGREPSAHEAGTWTEQALTVMGELLSALPVTLEAGGNGSVERCGLLVEGAAARVEEAAMSKVGLRVSCFPCFCQSTSPCAAHKYTHATRHQRQ